MRRGTSLVEALFAVVLIGVPVLASLSLSESATRRANRAQLLVIAHIALAEGLDRAAAMPLDALRGNSLSLELIRGLGPQWERLGKSLRVELAEDVEGLPGLHLITLSVELSPGDRVSARRLMVAAR